MLSLVLLLIVAVASARGATGIISDVNNMLRDTQSTSSAPVPLSLATTMPSSVELLRFVNDEDNDNDDDTGELEMLSNGAQVSRQQLQQQQKHDEADDVDKLKLSDQVRLLTKQLNALMTRRREDYELLEHNLRKSLRLTTDAASVDADVRSELDQLRCVTRQLPMSISARVRVCEAVGAWQIDGLISSATKRLQLWHLQLASNFVPHLLAKSFWTARLKSSGRRHTHMRQRQKTAREQSWLSQKVGNTFALR